jgi:PAS domain S-box-containing protein
MKRSELDERLREQREHLAPLLEISPSAIVITDLDSSVVAWNPAAEHLFGYTADEALGHNLDDLVAKREELHEAAVWYSERTRGKDHVETITRRSRKDGTLVDVKLRAAPVLVDGELVGTFGIYHDISELQRQKQYYEALLEVSPAGIVAIDPEDNVTLWNPAAERLFGYTAEEAVGRHIDDLVANDEQIRREAETLSRKAETGAIRGTTRRTRKDGSLVDVELLGAPIIVGGEQVGRYVIYFDVSELQRRKQYYEALLELSPTAITTVDPDDNLTSWNPAAERLFGYTAEEAMGRNIDDLVANREAIHDEGVEISGDIAEHQVRITTRRTRKDGSLVDVDVAGAPIHVGGQLVGKYALYHDISDLQEQRRYLQALVELSPTAIVVTDLDARVRSWNPAAEQLFGYTAEEAVGQDLDDLVANRADLHEEGARYTQAALKGERVRAFARRTRKDGSLVDVELISEPIVVGEKPLGFLAIYHDISELQRQKRYFEAVLQLSPTAIVTVDEDFHVTSWNPAAEELFGYTAEEAMGRLIDDMVANSPELREEAASMNEAGAAGERARAISRRTRKDGSFVDVEIVAGPVHVAGERVGHSVIYHDISEIQQQRRYYEALVEASPVAVVLLDVDGNTINSWNPAAERLFGYTPEEAIGRDIADVVASTEEVRAESAVYGEQLRAGEAVHGVTQRTRKDGRVVDVELLGVPVVVGGERVGNYLIYHDISEVQQARRDAEAATRAKSAFLATMSHEIRTPLNAVIGMTGLLLDTPLSPEQRGYAEVVRGSGDALLGVINDILDFSKIEAGRLELERAPFDLRECVESALELVAAAVAKKGLDIAYDMDPVVPAAVVGDVTRVRQVIINLLTNAVKFTEHGEVVLTVAAESIAPGDGDQVRLHVAVRDTGIGIPEDRMERLFESFSQVDPSTTRRYGGTGLGLAISKRVVEAMSGRLWAESRMGQGSTFHFTMQAEVSEAPVRAYERPAAPQLEGRRVLIVDDNATNRQILARQTQSWGMLARATESPDEALEWIRQGDPFDVAILDMQMPGMDGLTLAGEIRRHRGAEALPLVMLTSLGRPDETATEVQFAAYLTKPIKPSHLFDTLLEVFGAGPDEEPAVEAEPPESMADERPMRILVVEDNAVNQQLALLLLEKVGYRADVAANGVEALEALERQPYDVVLMDVEMPEMDGLEATRRIHQRWAKQRPHIVAVTANAMEGERELCLQAGMDDYITKPIRMEDLTAALAKGAQRTPAQAPVLDPDVVQRLIGSFGDPQSVRALIDTFLEHAPGQMQALREGAERGDAEGVRRTAHTLKSNAATFGASELADRSRDLEARTKEGILEGASGLVARIERELRRATEALKRLREEL